RMRIDVHKHRGRPGTNNGFRCSNKSVGRKDDFVARSDVQCGERQSQRVGSISDTDRVPHFTEFRKCRFEFFNCWSANKCSAFECLFPDFQQIGPQSPVFSFHIHEWHFHSQSPVQLRTGLKYIPRLGTGINRLIFEIVVLGTRIMSPALKCRSSVRSIALNMRLMFTFFTSTRSSEYRRKSRISELFALSLRPPAMVTTCTTVVSPRRSYLPGFITSPPTTK